MREFVYLGLNSIGIIAIISFFMGAVITLQTAYNTENPIYPKYLIGLGCRDSMILEFSSTIAALDTRRKSRIKYCLRNRNYEGNRANRRTRDNGSKFCILSDSAENDSNAGL